MLMWMSIISLRRKKLGFSNRLQIRMMICLSVARNYLISLRASEQPYILYSLRFNKCESGAEDYFDKYCRG